MGGITVAYNCPECRERLRSATNQIGKKDACPTCQTQFIVPGEQELHRLQSNEKAASERRAAAAAVKVAATIAKREVKRKAAVATREAAALNEKRTQNGNNSPEELGEVEIPTPQQRANARGCLLVCLSIAATFVILLIIGLIVGPNGSVPDGHVPDGSARPGAQPMFEESTTLRISGGGTVPVANSQEAHDRLIQLSAANDSIGVNQMMLTGSVWTVPSGTRCRVIEVGFFTSEVRILDGTNAGRECFVASDFVER